MVLKTLSLQRDRGQFWPFRRKAAALAIRTRSFSRADAQMKGCEPNFVSKILAVYELSAFELTVPTSWLRFPQTGLCEVGLVLS